MKVNKELGMDVEGEAGLAKEFLKGDDVMAIAGEKNESDGDILVRKEGIEENQREDYRRNQKNQVWRKGRIIKVWTSFWKCACMGEKVPSFGNSLNMKGKLMVIRVMKANKTTQR